MATRARVNGAGRPRRSDCPIACTLDLIGDKWTLLIVRDLFFGKRRFSQFLESDEGIKTNILTERLRRLERAGLIKRRPYQEHPPRYEYRLTRAGRDLAPVVKAVAAWGGAHVAGTRSPRGRSR